MLAAGCWKVTRALFLRRSISSSTDNTIQVKDAAGHLVRPRIGVDPVTEDLQNEWVYFGPMHGSSLYRIKAADLADEGLDAKTLGQKVERYSTKPICDEIGIDKDNNIIWAIWRKTRLASSSRIEAI